MGAMLRLGGKDRSSFLFKKLGLHNTEDAPTDTKAGVEGDNGLLPALAHIDTESFLDFFDRFQTQNAKQEANGNTSSISVDSSTHKLLNASICAHQSCPTQLSAEPERDVMLRAQTAAKLKPTTPPSNNSAEHPPLIMRDKKLFGFQLHRTTVARGQAKWPRKGPASTSAVARSLNTPDTELDLLHQERAELESTERTSQPNASSRFQQGNPLRRSISLTRAAEAGGMAKPAELPSSPRQAVHRAQTSTTMAHGLQLMRSRELFSVHELDCRLRSARQGELRANGTKATTTTRRAAADLISASAAENIIYRIMYHLTDVKDLQSTTLVSKGFMNTFKRNETTLVSHLMYQASKPAWELRRNILLLRRMKEFHLNDYLRDLQTMNGLKRLILDRCRSILSPKTITGLTGEDRTSEVEVENSLWRIWSFCVLFGEQAHEPFAGLPWLNGRKAGKSGFVGGNGDGLSPEELDSVMGTWMCLQRLLSRFHGRQDEAQKSGIFDNWSPALGWTKEKHVQEWTAYLLSLGPETVLSVCSGNGLFESAKGLGLTQWPLPPPGQTRANFLTSTISHIYQERARRETAAVNSRRTDTRLHQFHLDSHQHRSRIDMHLPQSHIGIYLGHLIELRAMFPATASNDPTLFHTLTATTTTASAKLGATLFPVNYTNQTARMPARMGQKARPEPPKVDVVDPVDQHLSLLVHQLGFDEANAKRALAMSDSGSGINVRRAIEILLLESKQREEPTANTPVELPTPVLLPNTSPQMKGPQQSKTYDQGPLGVEDCKPPFAKSPPSTTTGGGGPSGKPGSGLNHDDVDGNLGIQNTKD
ncbi:hypothetical protein DV735_g3668, partial [Chaetothyriales sp. CBS 134920]